jgi:P27 family predicted phage terminase small subunit
MQPPEYFNESAANYFNFIVEELEKIDRLQQTDRPIIEGLAFNLSMMEECQKRIMIDGSIINGVHGLKVHPSVDVLNRSLAKVNEAYKILGLSADLRLRLDQKEEGQSDFITTLIGGNFDDFI